MLLAAGASCGFDESLPGPARLLCAEDADCVDRAVCAADGVCRPPGANLPPQVAVGAIARVVGPLAVPLTITDVDDATVLVSAVRRWAGSEQPINLVPGVLVEAPPTKGDAPEAGSDAGIEAGDRGDAVPLEGIGRCTYDGQTAGQPTVALPAGPTGVRSCLIWKEPSFLDDGDVEPRAYVQDVRLVVTAQNPDVADVVVVTESGAGAYGNTPPVGDPAGGTSAVVVSPLVSGIVPLALRLRDDQGDEIEVTAIEVLGADGARVDARPPAGHGGFEDAGMSSSAPKPDVGPSQRFETTAGTTVVVGVIWDSSGYPPTRDAQLRIVLKDKLMTDAEPAVTLLSDRFELLGGRLP